MNPVASNSTGATSASLELISFFGNVPSQLVEILEVENIPMTSISSVRLLPPVAFVYPDFILRSIPPVDALGAAPSKRDF
jgi:hypothetical protein